jgi:hypothetical protein
MDDAYLLLRDLADLAARHRLALVAAVRLRQDRRDSKRDLDWLCGCGLGTVLALGRDRANSNRRFLLPARCVDDRDDLSIAFRVEEAPDPDAESARVEWLVEPLATDTAKARAGMLRARESRRDAAGVWLVEAVSNGPVYVKELERLAECAGHAWSTVRLAKGELPIEIKTPVTDGVGRSHWALRAPNPPVRGDQTAAPAQEEALAHGLPSEHAENCPE